MPRKRPLILVAVVGVIGAGAWSVFQRSEDTQYRTARVECGDIVSTVSATGTPNAVVTVQVGSQVSGNILALYADFNTKVKKGQVVARIDPAIFQARVDQAKATLNAQNAAVVNAQAQIERSRADLAAAEAAIANAKANAVRCGSAVNDAKAKLARRLQLAREGVLSQEDRDTAQATYDQAVANLEAADAQVRAAESNALASQLQVRVAETQLASAQAQVKQTEASLAQAQADLDHTYILAPVNGVVVARRVDVGQTVAASLQAPTLFEIAEDLAKMQVDTNVSEADVSRVRLRMPASFTVDAYPGQVFQGIVNSIRKAAINVQNVVTYDVVLSVPNPDLKLFPGMTANVKILVDQHHDALKIPNAALRFRPAEAPLRTNPVGKEVWILGTDNKPKRIPVTLGLTDGTHSEVTGGGLEEGDRVILASFSKKEQGRAATTPFGPGGRGGPRF